MYVIISRKVEAGASHRKPTNLLVVTKVSAEGDQESALQAKLNELADGKESHEVVQVIWK